MSAFAVELPGDDHAASLELLAMVSQWNRPPGRTYQTAEATGLKHPLLLGCARAFFIKMEPGTYVHRHRDPPEVVDNFYTDHVVVTTNDRAFIRWDDAGTERAVHLDLGKRYRIVDRGLLHWATNDGDSDRIHLLIEYDRRRV